jgi:hypothetical protein
MSELHPFWNGFLGEIRKEADALDLMANPWVAGGLAAGGTAAGLGAVALARKLKAPGTYQPAASAASAAAGGGFKAKHLAFVGLGSAALGAYAMKKHKEKQER